MQSLRARYGAQLPELSALHEFLSEISHDIASHGTFNMMLSNGNALFAHCSTKLHYIERQHPFNTAALSDEDVSVDFSAVTTPQGRVAVILTEPLTTNEQRTALLSGELKVFVDGRVVG